MSLPYVDPGLGSFLWQVLVATLLSLSFYARRASRWIQCRFRKSIK